MSLKQVEHRVTVTELVPTNYHVFKLLLSKNQPGCGGWGETFCGRLVYWRRYGVVLLADA